MKLSISKRISLVLSLTLVACLGIMSFILLSQQEDHYKDKSLESITELSKSINESVTFSMSQGTTDIAPFIERFKNVDNISELRITPTNKIKANSENMMDNEEVQVLKTKKDISHEEIFQEVPVYRIVEPILATEDCMTCHEVNVGEPLAIVSLRYSMKATNNAIIAQRLNATIMSAVTVILAFFIVMYFLKKYVIKDLLKSVECIEKLSSGDVTDGIKVTRNDELGKLLFSICSLRGTLKAQAESAQKIADGDLSAQITIISDQDILGKSMTHIKENLNILIKDLNTLSDSAINGNLNARANADQHQGDYKTIVKGFNDTLDAVTTPIQDGAKVLAEIAGGDLAARVNNQYKGDQKIITDSINKVADALAEAMTNVRNLVISLANVSSQISSSTEEMAVGAQEQSTQATEVAGAIEEMTATILETTKNATSAAQFSQKAGETAKNGGEVVKQTVNGMNRIAEVVNNAALTVKDLGKNSDKIGEIIQVIDDIADQTNLLALNAAIEAARAGEQGRGFAVVADEVRKLAERTTKATKEIAEMIKQIQKDTGNAVTSIESGTKEVESGKELANKAIVALDEIIERTNKTIDVVNQVAAASEEQSAAAEEISKSIEGISNVTQQSATGIQHIAGTAEELRNLTDNLQDLIGKFRIDDVTKDSEKSNYSVRSNGKLIHS